MWEGADAEMDRLKHPRSPPPPGGGGCLLAHPRRPAAASPTDIRLTTYAPDRLTYAATTTARGGALAQCFSEVYFPTKDGTPPSTKPGRMGRVDYPLSVNRW